MTRFFVVLVGYTPSKSARAANLCNRLSLILRLRGCETKKIFIDNSSVQEFSPSLGWETLAGSNSFAEFSGYQEGLNYIRETYTLSASDVCLFVNDTINSHRKFSLLREFHLARMLINLPKYSFGGYIESCDWAGFSICSRPITEWVSTYAFALDSQSLRKLDYKIEHKELFESIDIDNLSHSMSSSYSVSDPLRDHIIKWLSEDWYNAKPISLWNSEKLKLKVACILNEKLLSAKCLKKSISIIDFQDPYIKFEAQYAYWSRLIERLETFVMLPYRLLFVRWPSLWSHLKKDFLKE
jgi:hypothetical protein